MFGKIVICGPFILEEIVDTKFSPHGEKLFKPVNEPDPTIACCVRAMPPTSNKYVGEVPTPNIDPYVIDPNVPTVDVNDMAFMVIKLPKFALTLPPLNVEIYAFVTLLKTLFKLIAEIVAKLAKFEEIEPDDRVDIYPIV